MANFPANWNAVLGQPEAASADVVFSLTEDAINAYLQGHFRGDPDKYHFLVKQTFQTTAGAVREFDVAIQARTPLVVTLPPLASARSATGSDWLPVPARLKGPSLHAPRDGTPDPNIRVNLAQLGLSITWDKLDGTGKWTWTPTDISAEVQCYVQLQARKPSPNDADSTSSHYLTLTPTSIAFSKTDKYQLSAQFQAFINRLPPADKQLVMSEAVDKFDDLLVIALNVVAARVAPQMVQSLEIPSPVFLRRNVVPAGLILADKQISVALGFDRQAQSAQNRSILERELSRFERAVEDDLLEHGGFAGLALKPGQEEERSARDLELYSTDEIVERMRNTRGVIERLQRQHADTLVRLRTRPGAAAPPGVTGGIGVAVDEAILNSLLQDALPAPQNQCSDWLTVADIVRGRACYWARLFDAHVAINGTAVAANVGINAGGSLEACVRKFWDCSWSWDCGSLALWVSGYPGLKVFLKEGNGLTFTAEITGGVALEMNLPFPFNKVIEAVSGLIIQFIIAIVNIFARNITITIVPPVLTIPSQNTKLWLTHFQPFSYLRPNAAGSRQRFIAYSVDVSTIT